MKKSGLWWNPMERDNNFPKNVSVRREQQIIDIIDKINQADLQEEIKIQN